MRRLNERHTQQNDAFRIRSASRCSSRMAACRYRRDTAPRLDARGLGYNHLLKDFDNAPHWFVEIAQGMRDWRARSR